MKATGFKTFKRTVEMQDGVKLFLDSELSSRLLALLATNPVPGAKNLNLLRAELERLGVKPTPGYGFCIKAR